MTSNFSYSHSVFKSFVLQTLKNQGLFGKGLTHYLMTILDLTKLIALADDKINVTHVIISLFDSVENIAVKKKMLVTSIFFFSQCFRKPFFFWVVESWDCVVER